KLLPRTGVVGFAVVGADGCAGIDELGNDGRSDAIDRNPLGEGDYAFAEPGRPLFKVEATLVRVGGGHGWSFIRHLNFAIRHSSPQSQPCASRTLSIVARMVFHVRCSSSMALGNMQPSQQMWRMPRSAAPFSQ